MFTELANSISYCTNCTSILYWDKASKPRILKLGNDRLSTCLSSGCNLLFTSVPPDCAEIGEFDLLKLALIWNGVPDEDADTAMQELSFGHEALAA